MTRARLFSRGPKRMSQSARRTHNYMLRTVLVLTNYGTAIQYGARYGCVSYLTDFVFLATARKYGVVGCRYDMAQYRGVHAIYVQNV